MDMESNFIKSQHRRLQRKTFILKIHLRDKQHQLYHQQINTANTKKVKKYWAEKYTNEAKIKSLMAQVKQLEILTKLYNERYNQYTNLLKNYKQK